ncbi:MAG: hypothetical protein ABFD54_00590 [Armatimonadota bacterium]|nr:hypothetical protein [bacterium]
MKGFVLALVVLSVVMLTLPIAHAANTGNYVFDGSISREVLENYLSRSDMYEYLSTDTASFEEGRRFIKNIQAKMVCRAATDWGGAWGEISGAYMSTCKNYNDILHRDDPQLIIQCAILESINKTGRDWPVIPDWVCSAFGQSYTGRNFDYNLMIYADGKYVNHWGTDSSVPDISRVETQMWFYYRATEYIDAGFEAIHLGQMSLMGENDTNYTAWNTVITKIRAYAALHAPRHYVLIDGTPDVNNPPIVSGKLLLDFILFPQRPTENVSEPQKAYLQMGRTGTIYGLSPGGTHPSGWTCTRSPYLLDFDHWANSSNPGTAGQGILYVWGYDETDWYARQPESYRNYWLSYVTEWLQQNDPNGFLVMPGHDVISTQIYSGDSYYHANTASPACPNGFNQEKTIKKIWGVETPVRKQVGHN